MEGAFIGSIIFEFIGSIFRWLYIAIVRKIKGKKVVSFKKVWDGRDNKLQKRVGYGISNIFLGMLIILVVVILIKISISLQYNF